MTSLSMSGCVRKILRSICQSRKKDWRMRHARVTRVWVRVGASHCYTWAYGDNRLGNTVTY